MDLEPEQILNKMLCTIHWFISNKPHHDENSFYCKICEYLWSDYKERTERKDMHYHIGRETSNPVEGGPNLDKYNCFN